MDQTATGENPNNKQRDVMCDDVIHHSTKIAGKYSSSQFGTVPQEEKLKSHLLAACNCREASPFNQYIQNSYHELWSSMVQRRKYYRKHI
jgi:hypothetical protein